ncbi:hypothetical protein CANARDRAFT_183295, partial [[Candida] arabinofermentans NRRL YB-2248]
MLGLIVISIKLIELTDRKITESKRAKRKALLASNPHHQVSPFSPSVPSIPPPPAYLQSSPYFGREKDRHGSPIYTTIPRDLASVEVRYNKYIESIVFTSRTTGKRYTFGYWKSTAKYSEVISLEEGEKINGIVLKMGKFLNRVKIEPRRLSGNSKTLGGKVFKVPIDGERTLVGVKGRYCEHINSIQFVTSL